jgi:hypothetical protein
MPPATRASFSSGSVVSFLIVSALTEPRFTLIYFGASDSGTLFYAGTADYAGLALWPEGFRQKHVAPAADADALTTAFANR